MKDVTDLFDYIEPADKNLEYYSFRIHALLLRACVEVEANFQAILTENGYIKDKMTMTDYKKVNMSHQLWAYQIKVPIWSETSDVRSPFLPWNSGMPISWYQVYNTTKHNRHAAFELATFGNLLDAVCGLLVLLSSQFETNDFASSDYMTVGVANDGMKNGIGGFFRVRFPDDWPQEMRYDFDWHTLEHEEDPFQTIDYSSIV